MAVTEERLSAFKVADVSTGHMTLDDSAILDELGDGESATLPLIAITNYGYLVYVQRNEDDFDVVARALSKRGFSSLFIAVIRRAREEGCSYVFFDQDGERYASLEETEW